MNITTKRILKLVETTGKSFNKLENDLNLAGNSFKYWQIGRTNPSADAVVKIARFFDVSTDFLHGLTNDIEPKSALVAPNIAEITQQFMETLAQLSPAEQKQLKINVLKHFID